MIGCFENNFYYFIGLLLLMFFLFYFLFFCFLEHSVGFNHMFLWFYAIQVRGIVHQRISEFAKKEALPSLTRSGCAYLMQVGLI
jgi:hypothetical protein